MKRYYYLPGLNSKSKKEFKTEFQFQALIDSISLKEFNLLHKFINDTNSFYREIFDGLNKHKIREKRLLDFETPNRARIVHEFDISLDSKFDYNQYYYLFNPKNRLSWLKIKQEDKRLIVASKDKIEIMVKNVLDDELKILVKNQYLIVDDLFKYIWNNQQGYPCFIKLENINCENFLIEAEYFDSIKVDIPKYNNRFNIFLPFDERVINYEYYPLRNRSSWLYVRSPKNFNISLSNILFDKKINTLDSYSSINNSNNNDCSDPEIKTFTIINIKDAEADKYNVYFNIEITLPSSLKTWFLTIYWASILILILLIFNLLNIIYLNLGGLNIFTLNPIESIVNHDSFNNIVLALVAAIIATRGWLISEETILKRYSNFLTILMTLLIIIPIITRLFIK